MYVLYVLLYLMRALNDYTFGHIYTVLSHYTLELYHFLSFTGSVDTVITTNSLVICYEHF